MRKNIFYKIMILISTITIMFIIIPLISILCRPALKDLIDALKDREVLNALKLSIYASFLSSLISLILGTPIAYVLSRKKFPFKKLIEGIIDLPIMIPHPVIGLAILAVVSRDHIIGKFLYELSVEIMGTVKGITIVLVYVGLPFYINTLKAGIDLIPERLEYISRTLGKNQFQTFFRIVLPLSKKSIIEGVIMSTARAISEFGAVIVIAYHPMVAPVLIYERFTAYGLKYSSPVAVLLILISLLLFIIVRFISSTSHFNYK